MFAQVQAGSRHTWAIITASVTHVIGWQCPVSPRNGFLDVSKPASLRCRTLWTLTRAAAAQDIMQGPSSHGSSWPHSVERLPPCVPQVIQSFVRQAMTYIDKTPDKATKVSLIKTLQTVTEGKV